MRLCNITKSPSISALEWLVWLMILVRAPLQSDNKLQKCVTCERTVCISPYSEALISAMCDRRYDNRTVLLEPLTQLQFRRFALARSLNRCENGRTVCRVINYDAQALVLLRGTKLATTEPLSVVASCKLFDERVDLQRDNVLEAVVSQPPCRSIGRRVMAFSKYSNMTAVRHFEI